MLEFIDENYRGFIQVRDENKSIAMIQHLPPYYTKIIRVYEEDGPTADQLRKIADFMDNL